MLLDIVWNVDPEFFSIGKLTVRWYGVLWALGIWLSLVIQQKIYKAEKLPEEWTDKLFMYIVGGTIIGARLGHCLFYEWHLLPEPAKFLGITFNYYNPFLQKPWEILYIWQGGLASHGGAIGILTAAYLLNKKVFKKGFIWLLDRLIVSVAICGACIRLGNLMNSEIYGNVTNLPWGFIFEQRGETLPKHPTQIYEMIYCLVTFALVWWMYWKKQAYKIDGLLFGVFLIGIFLSRFVLEFIKMDQETFESNMLFNMGQWLSIPFIAAGIYYLVRARRISKEMKILKK